LLLCAPFRFVEEASAAHLEAECFKKYQKVGKTFYNSQVAATVRWLSSSGSDQIHDRLQALTDQITDHDAASSSPCVASDSLGKKPGEASDSSKFAKRELSNESAKTGVLTEYMDPSRVSSSGEFISEARRDCTIDTMELPKVPSFAEFMRQKGRNSVTSSSKADSRPRGILRKASPIIKEGTTSRSKKMKP
jgi:bloom syndrome protein